MKKKLHLLFLLQAILSILAPATGLLGQNFKAVNDTIDLYPGIPKTVNLMANDTIPYGDSIRLNGGNAPGSALITITNVFKGFITYLVKPIWGFNGNQSGTYSLTDFTISKISTAKILFRIHDRSYDSLDINNVKAAITAYGNEFWLPANGRSGYKVPKSGNAGTLFNSVLWIGGKGSDSALYLAAERYRQGPGTSFLLTNSDYHAGPVMDSVNYSADQDTAWSRVWKVQKSDVDYHKSHWNMAGYHPPESILNWPGNGNPAYGIAQNLAPFFDRNGDGIYSAMDGDYPLIRGDEAVYAIFNDDRDDHKDSGGKKLRVEIHLMAYAFDMPDDTAFKNTIFFHYTIFNRSSRTYYNTYLGLFNDMDIGYSGDDYIGCDVERNSIIGFNGSPTDGNGETNAYGAHPPAQSVTILKGPLMDPAGHDRPRFDLAGHPLCNESVNGTGFGDSIADNEHYGMTNFLMFINDYLGSLAFMNDPATAPRYYRAMQSLWIDSTRLYYGGAGHAGFGGYGPDCRFMFPGESDSLNWGTGCVPPNGAVSWTAKTAQFAPTDIRGTCAMGPFTFPAGESRDLDLAFVFARDYTGQDTLDPSVAKLRQMIDIVRNSYQSGILPNGNAFFGISDQPALNTGMKIYPNPAGNRVTLAFDQPVRETITLRILTAGGTQVSAATTIPEGKTLQLDVSRLASGVYILTVTGKSLMTTGKLVIIR